MKYIKQLDSTRAIAVILVILCHWGPIQFAAYFKDIRPGRLGALGVDSFFVLSGYLITGILLKGKEKIDAGTIGIKTVFKNFYIRRALRIFPIFYLYILFLFVTSFFGFGNREELIYGATYTINFFFYRKQYWGAFTTHLWSLAVEEQFYIFWPFIVLIVNRKLLPGLMVLLIAIAVFTQLHIDSEFGGLITYTCLDAFCIGALFAWTRNYVNVFTKIFTRLVTAAGIISMAIFCYQYATLNIMHLPQRTLHALIAMMFIANIVFASDKQKFNVINWLAGNRVLVFLGKISYGIYLYHLPIPYFSEFLFAKAGSPFNQLSPAWQFVINLVLLLVISIISWRFIEQPILRFKKYFSSDEK